MGVRKSHNRSKDKSFFSKDMNETIKKAKVYYKSWGQFYIGVIKNGTDLTYYADGGNHFGQAIKHFKNTAGINERAVWKEVEIIKG